MFKNKLVGDVTASTVVFLLNRSMAFLRGFVVARLLDPALYGYFSGLGLIFLYNSQGHLGILHGLNRNLSIARGANDPDSCHTLKNNAITAIGFLSMLISIGIVLFSFLKEGEYDSKIIWGMRIYAVVAVMYHMEYLYHSFLRAEHRFREINISRLLFTGTNLLLVLVLAQLFSFYGVIAALALSMILQNAYLMSKVRIRPCFSLDFKLLKGLIVVGAPISLVFLVNMLLNSADRLMIIRFLTPEQLGFYGIALTFSMELMLRIPEIISYVIYPRILEKYGQTGNPSDLLSFFQAPSILIGCIMAVTIGLMFLSIDYVITSLLPRYTPAILVTKILVFSVYFISINQVAVRIIIAIKRTRALLLFQALAIIGNLVLNYIAIASGYGIAGVAVATGISFFFYSVAVTHSVLKMLSLDFLTSFKQQISLYLPFVYCIMALGFVEKLKEINIYFPFEFMLVAFNMLAFAILVSPMVWYALRTEEFKTFLKANA